MKNLTVRIDELPGGQWVVNADNVELTVFVSLTARSVGDAIATAYGLLRYYLEEKEKGNA